MSDQTSNRRSHPPGYSPAALALQNWRNEVSKLEAWEQMEVEIMYQTIGKLLSTYQSSAALAVTRIALEIGQLHGQ